MLLDRNILSDIYMNIETGDPEISGGDFKISQGVDCLLSQCAFRIKTNLFDFILEPQCGASLEETVGEPNSPETGSLIKGKILRALTHDGFLTSQEVEVIIQPISLYEIMATIIITYSGVVTVLTCAIDLAEGKVSLFN